MKTAIITGGAEGLGADIATLLSDKGYRVGLLDIRADLVHETAKAIPNSVALVADVTQADQVADAFAAFGDAPDLLVNNAGIVRFGPMEEQSIEDFQTVININILGSCICARQAALGMLVRGSGHIINFTSVNAVHPSPNIGMYSGTKAAMANLTEAMAIEWGPRGLRVNSIAPGFINAGMSRPIYADPKVREKRGSGVPSRRLGEARDIAEAVLFLDSEGASYINGHQLVVDGGVSISVMAHLPRD
jgi:NAD(P)-dependent dehydrogenase (short-subunit alcohol dehydrogenase family)